MVSRPMLLLLSSLTILLTTAQTTGRPSGRISSHVKQAIKPIAEAPQNVAVYAGDTVVLRCVVDQPPPVSRVLWAELTDETGGMPISNNEDVLPGHPSSARYRIIHTADNEFNLEISGVRLSDGGQYICQDSRQTETFRASAQLVVLASAPVCTTTLPNNGVTLEGQSFTAECVLPYHGRIRPTMTWTGPPPFDVTHSPPADSSRVWTSLSYIVNRDMDSRNFQCLTSFTDLGSQPEDMAKNLPTLQTAYQAPQIFVYWGPRNTEVSPLKEEYEVGDVIYCMTDAFPAAMYAFQNLRTLQIFYSQTFTVTEDMRGFPNPMRCQAQNLIQGFVYSDNVLFYVNVQ